MRAGAAEVQEALQQEARMELAAVQLELQREREASATLQRYCQGLTRDLSSVRAEAEHAQAAAALVLISDY